MTAPSAKLAAVRAVLKRAGKPLAIESILPRVEGRLRQVVGRARLYRLLAVVASQTGEITITGARGRKVYGLAECEGGE